MDTADFDSYEPPAIGTRFDIEDVAIEYVGEYYFDYYAPTEDKEYEFALMRSDNGESFDGPSFDDFVRIGEPWAPIPRLTWFDGIAHDTINSGYLIKLTDDGEGAFIFRHWGK